MLFANILLADDIHMCNLSRDAEPNGQVRLFPTPAEAAAYI